MTLFTFRAFARRGAGLVVLLLFVSPAVTARGASNREDFDETVLSCEEALARLERCCPSFPVETIACVDDTFEHSGCGSTTKGRKLPAYTHAESTCIRDTSCEGLVKNGVCARAAAVKQRGAWTTIYEPDSETRNTTPPATTNYNTQPAVCP